MTYRALVAVVLALALSLAGSAAAQTPRIGNARLTTRPAGAGVQREIVSIVRETTSPVWVGYAVPIVDGDRAMCCGVYYSDGRTWREPCGLEGRRSDSVNITMPGSNTVKLEGPTTLVVLLRVENHEVGRIRAFTEECEIDAGGLPVTWLTDVKPPDSVALLVDQVTAGPAKLAESAVTAIAMHKDPAADRALDQLLDPRRPVEVRKKATFWLGSARGRSGLERLKRVLKEDPDERVRDSATVGLSVSSEPDAIPTLIATARDDASTRVRGQALFWLAQKAGERAAATITASIENDPETEVKKKAVFALSQLPRDEGVPLLINVARTNRNPEVRKQAVFWLGQSKDPRALKFFEEVLGRR